MTVVESERWGSGMNTSIVRIKNWFMNRPLQVKICITVYILVVALFSVLLTILTGIANKNIREEQLKATGQAVSYGMLLIEKEQSYLLGIATHYSINSEVQAIMRASNRGEQGETLSSDIMSVSQSRMYVLSLTFYDLNGKAITHMSIDASWGPVDQDPNDNMRPFGRLISKQRIYEWEYIPKASQIYLTQDNSPKLCLWHVVKDNTTYLPIGAVAITLDARKLLSTQAEVRPSFDTILVINEDGMLVDGKGPLCDELTKSDRITLLENTLKYANIGNFEVSLQSNSYYVSYGKIRETPCTLYALVSNRTATTSRDILWVSSVAGISACILLLLPMLVVSARFITRPLKILADGMNRFAEGNRDVQIHFSGKDEIGNLGNIFNKMVQKNRELVETNYELTIRKQAAELAVLQAQVDPHFIYNMLNIIQWTAIDEGKQDLAEMVHSVGTVMRFNLNRGYDFVTVHKEVELLNCYCNMQKRRFKDRVLWKLDVETVTLNACIPKLIIQPLIENSIVHGITDSKQIIRIFARITLEKDNNKLRIEVEDDGVGIQPDILRVLPDGNYMSTAPIRKSSNQLALKNIYERLMFYYGENNFTFNISSVLGSGTQILIRLPYDVSPPTPNIMSKDQREKDKK